MLITKDLQLKSLSDRELELLRLIIGYHIDGTTEITHKKLASEGFSVMNFASALTGLVDKGYLTKRLTSKYNVYTLNILNENI
jgi:hypothetical protein